LGLSRATLAMLQVMLLVKMRMVVKAMGTTAITMTVIVMCTTMTVMVTLAAMLLMVVMPIMVTMVMASMVLVLLTKSADRGSGGDGDEVNDGSVDCDESGYVRTYV
jgi:hypothetical protein